MTSPERIASRYGVRPQEIREVPGGVANRTVILGDNLFLRIPRGPEYEADLRKEVAVIPVARAAGVRTPAIIDFDDTRALTNAPYLVMERIHATDLVDSPTHDPSLWTELGGQLRLLHNTKFQHLEGVPTDEYGDPRPTVDRLATDGYLDTGTANWLLTWFDRLATRFDREAPNVLLHGDLATQNVMVDSDGRYCALIDWATLPGDQQPWSSPSSACESAPRRTEVLQQQSAGQLVGTLLSRHSSECDRPGFCL
ncbi:aminoglycoside phosphotransferase family protein [Kribbella sp. NPDC006257]|uniref:phosphotransferase family protein n=1 Tax=Kribbella sp. NPDC006257 TaxID=3156738 RepID=UPI0033B71DD5